jgi:inositol-pentakisphosphate 2-kinase
MKISQGGANICFRMSLRTGTPYQSLGLAGPLRSEQTWVLRVRKSHAAEGYTTREVYDFHERQILPLFKGFTTIQPLHYDLMRMSRGAIDALNSLLAIHEDQDRRQLKRTGDTVSTRDPHCLLMEDFSGCPPHEFSFEFKPKWLTQSPSAPRSATHCRNCALLAKRYLESGASVEHQPDSVCPLNLMSDSGRYVREQARILYAKYEGRYRHQADSASIIRRLTEFFDRKGLGGQVLKRLKFLQEKHDPHGVIQTWKDWQAAIDKDQPFDEKRIKELALAMTLRDCSLLFCVPRDPNKPIRACIADLDPKPWHDGPVSKLEQWWTTETALIDGGYYMRRGRYPWNMEDRKDFMLCALQTSPPIPFAG